MGKSKFPGKPSKLVHKKRISVVHTNESPPDNGNLRFKDSDGGPENIGSDSKVSQKPPLQSCMKGSALATKDDDADTKNDDDDDKDEDDTAASDSVAATSTATPTTPTTGKKVKIGGVSFDAKTAKSKKKTVTFKNQLETSDDTNIVRKVYNPIGAPLAPIIKKECLNRAIRFKRSSCIVRPSRLTEIVKLSESKNELLQLAANQTGLNVLTKTTLDLNNSLTAITAAAASAITYQSAEVGDAEPEKSPSMSPVKIDGGGDSCFVLPKRSLHSKRVIKPNKRFLDGMISTKCRKKKILGKKLHKYRLDFHSSAGGDNNIWKAEGGVATTDEAKMVKTEMGRTEFGSSMKGKPAIYNAFSKVILREPKLNVTTFNFGSAFDMLANKNKTASLIPCNICGVISSFENPLQARKYGANCCEICRKFISKMIKKLALPATAETKPIECTNGDGGCRIEPLQKNSPTKFSHNIFKERCQCCWLKRGLEIFHLPSMIRMRLVNFLPVAMRDIRTLNLNSFVPKYSPFFLDQASAAAEKNETFNIFASAMKTTSMEAASSLSIFAKDMKCASPTTMTAEKEVPAQPSKEPSPSVTEEAEKSVESEAGEPNVRAIRSRAKTEEVAAATTTTEPVTTTTTTTTTSTPPADGPKRQKIDLKGPRVKHVCRSASIVLGQPLATFGDGNEEAMITEEEGVPLEETKSAAIEDGSLVITTVPEKEEKASVEPVVPPAESEKVAADKLEVKIEPGENLENAPPATVKAAVKKIEAVVSKPNTRKVFNRPSTGNGANCAGLLTSKNINSFIQPHHKKAQLTVSGATSKEKPKKLTICIDFWENYDPVEVSRYGFGQIVAEGDDKSLAALKAICFLCGSAGHDRMIFCVCCCEPYHQFCIDEYNTLSGVPAEHPASPGGDTSLIATKMDESDEDLGKTNQGNQESRLALLNWLCPRCTVCNTCNMTMGLKVKCQKCQKSYHNQCLGTNKRLFGADRPLICSNCLKCKSCGTTNVSKFVGNLPLCSACFRLRRKGNFCPLCQKCYEDNDFELKMMECGGCIRWVHARCEGLTDEQYNLLSVLPEHIEFICRKCSKSHETEAKAWRDAVAAEFKTGLLNIVKLLSKSRQANAFLKLSPRKISNSICVCRPLESNRRIRFNEDSADESQNAVVPISSVADCHCQRPEKTLAMLTDKSAPAHLNLIDVKQKIHNDDYYSLQNFNYDMMTVIEPIMMVGGGGVAATTASEDLMITYKEILSETFPWFQNETKACTDILVEAMNDACLYNNDDQMCGGIMVISGDQNEGQQQPQQPQRQQRRQQNEDYDQTVPAAMPLPEDVEQFFYTNPKEADKRMCMFCKGVGETNANQEERLLYCGQNIWVHTNCALWSAEVFEEIDGSLQNVHSALSRGRLIKCSHCANKGATVGCNVRNCGEHFHYPCARQISCSFLSDKTVYCPLHVSEGARKNLKNESSFRVNRPIYVEYDRKKKKYVEPREVQFLIGSLYVENIGRIIPVVSDDAADCLIPCDYKCQRLYWSSKEPWRIVEYSIRTYIENTSTMGVDLGRNFTIDHTLNTQLVQLGLAKISRWHNNLADGGEEDGSLQMAIAQSALQAQQPSQYSSYQQRSGGERLTKARSDLNPYMSNLIDENNEEEPQANNDLLPPEIKDAIFEDLPHDILDGISMLDIFPKLMTYEDLMMDNKHENPFSLAVSGAGENSSRSDMKMENSNSSSLGGDSTDNADMAFSFFSGSSFRNELKRSNSDASSGTSKQATHQRSKFDVVAKKRKIGQSDMQFFGGGGAKAKTETNDVFEKLKISQLDGAEDLIEGPVMCDRCNCTYRTKDSYIRHLDSCELFSTSESESENMRSPTNSTTTSPPRIMFQQHQQQPQVSTLYFDNANNLIGNFENIDMNAMVTSSQQQSFQILNATPINTSVPSLQYTQQSIQPGGGVTITSPKVGTTSTTTTTTKVLNLQNFSNQMMANQRKPQKQYGNDSNQLTLTNGINFANNITQQVNQQIPQLISVTLASPQHQQTYQTTTSSATMVRNQPILSNQAKKQILPRLAQAPMQQPTHTLHSHKTTKTQKGLKKVSELMSQQTQPQQHHIEYNTQTLQPQQATTIRNLSQLPSNIIYQQPQQQILVQQMGQPNIMSYITTGDQQNPTLQYVTIPTGNELKTANGQSYLTTSQNPMLQGTLQSLTGDPNVGANSILVSTPNGLQMIPNTMQIAHMGQPQVIGTLIQPQGATIQCVNGMMSTEQMMLGAQPQLEMITDPASGCMYLTQAQPVYYGLETIVQNTVMSSQQFVSTAMQGVLSQNSSFSATTTQVFQSSKIEPIMEVPAGYVVLNNMTGDKNMNVLATTTTTTQQQQQQQQTPQQQQSIMPQLQASQFDGTYTIGKPQSQQATMASPQIIQSYAPSPQQQQQQQQIQQLQQQQQQIQQQINETSAQLMSSPPYILTGQASSAGKVQTQLVNKVQPQTLTTVPTGSTAPAVVNQIQITPAADQQHTQQPVLQLQNVIDQMNKQPQSILPKNVTIISNQTVSEPSYRLGQATPKMTNIIRPIKNEKLVNAVAVKPKVVAKMNKMAMKVNQAPVMQQQQIQVMQAAQAPPQTIVEPIVIKPQQQQQKMSASGVTMAAKVQMNARAQSNQAHMMQPQQQQQQQVQLPNMPPLGKIMEGNPRKSQITVTGPIKTTNTVTNSNVGTPKLNENFGAMKPTKEVPNTYLRQTAGQQQAKQIINFNVEKSKPAVTYSNKMKINYDNMPPLTPTMTPRRREDFVKSKPDGGHPINTLMSTGQGQSKMNDPQYQPEQPQQVNIHSVAPPTASNVIQLPLAPYVPSSTGIPTNIVNPMQQPTNTQSSCSATNVRPTNRVLPMQTINKQQKRQNQAQQAMQQHQPAPSMSHQPIPQYPPDVTITAINNISGGGGNNKTATPIDLDKTFDSLFECSKISANLDEELKLTNALGNDITIIKTNLLLDAAATPPPSHDEKLITRDDDISGFDLGDGSELGSKEDENTTSVGSNQATDNDVNSLFEDKISFSLEQSSSLSSDLRDEINKTPDIKEKISEILNNLDADDTSSATTATNVTPNVSMTSSASTQQFRQMEASRRQQLQTQDSTIDISLLRDSTSTSNFSLFGNSQKSATSTTSAASMIVEDSSNSSSGQSLGNSQLKYQTLAKSEVSNDSRQFMLSTPEPSTSTASTATTSQQQKPAAPTVAKASGPRLLYEIQSEDGFTYKSTSITEVWEKVFETVQLARKAHGLMPLPDGPLEEMKGHQMLGLKTNALRYLLEQLPGVEKCSKYKPKYTQLLANGKDGGSQVYATSTASSTQSCPSSTSGILSASSSLCFSDDDLKENPYGAARCEPYSGRSEYDMFSWLASRHRKQPVPVVIHSNVDDILIPRRGSGSNLPMAMRYRTLKETSKDYVGVYRSHIHGRGLFCTRDIEAGEMVIEYAGELIRSTLTDKREKYYNGRGIGCYMFKIDENFVVDATMRGNAARFINHACEPNCYSKVVDILGHKHIIIFALRRLSQGEELTYDYKFPFEDEKIPCSCGSKKCRKYLN